MAELADALGLEPSEGNLVEVRVLSSAPIVTLVEPPRVARAISDPGSPDEIIEVFAIQHFK